MTRTPLRISEIEYRQTRGVRAVAQPLGWEGLPYGYTKTDGIVHLREALDSENYDWQRVVHAAKSRLNAKGVAVFEGNELHDILGPTIDPETGQVMSAAKNVGRAIEKAVARGRLEPGSTPHRLIVPADQASYVTKTPWEQSMFARMCERIPLRTGTGVDLVYQAHPERLSPITPLSFLRSKKSRVKSKEMAA